MGLYLTLAGISILAIALVVFLYVKKITKKKFLMIVICYVGGLALVSSTFSVIYHRVGNEQAYQTCLKQKNKLLEEKTELEKDKRPGDVDYETRYKEWFNAVDRHNTELELDKSRAGSPWYGAFVYEYALTHFEELYIHL